MAHSHNEEQTNYYLDQLCTIGICAALGTIGVILWWRGALAGILADFFQQSVLIGSVFLLIVVAVRAVILWQVVGQPEAGQDHDHHHDHHEHEHDHDHEHEHAHDHPHEQAPPPALPAAQDHGHSHGWNPIRYIVLLLPIALFFLGLPNQEFNDYFVKFLTQRAQQGGGAFQRPADLGLVKMETVGDKPIVLGFLELSNAAQSENGRSFYEGKLGTVLGMYVPDKNDPKVFTLVRIKITCCFADAIPLNVTIVSPEPLPEMPPQQWVEVTGQIQFRPREGRPEKFVPVLQVRSRDDVKTTNPPARLFLQ